jgi:alkanesulfonate monooxygenase SsuD/methylene tetrahydromethanopterin reductase-like flavin-dependent oxidoreductase (luciferase family)
LPRIGLCFTGQPYSLRQMVGAAQWAEAHGYDSVWAAEDSWTGRDAITTLSCIAFGTTRIRVGTCLIGVATRNPALTAMTVNSLWEVASHRLVLGLGLALGWHTPDEPETGTGPGAGGRENSPAPLATMRGAVNWIRALTEGRDVPWGDMRRGMMIPRPWFTGAREPMNTRIPIYLGAVRPQMTRLAGELGDGLLLEMEALRDTLPDRLALFREGAIAAGRDPARLEIVKLVLASVSGRGEPVHPNALGWATKSVALLDDASVRRLGWDLERAGRIRDAWSKQDWESGKRLMTPEMVRAFIAAGPPDHILEVLDETVRQGVTLPVLIPYGGDLQPVLDVGARYAG